MSDPISSLWIQIKADATSALAAFKSVATGVQSVEQTAAAAAPATAAVSQALQEAGNAANKAGGHIAGASYYFRSFFDTLRFGIYGNPLAAFYMIDEATRAMVASGLGIARIIPIIGGAAAVVGAGALAWEEWNKGEREAAERTKELAAAWKSLPGLINDVFGMKNSGLLGPQQAGQYLDYLLGRKKLYVDGSGQVTTSPTRTFQQPKYITGEYGMQVPTAGEKVQIPNRAATLEEVQKYVQDQMTAGGEVSQEYLESVKQSKELIEKTNEESLDGIAKQKAQLRDKYEQERQEILRNIEIQRAQLGNVSFDDSKMAKQLRQALAETFIAEQKGLADLEDKAAAEAAKKQQAVLDKLKEARTEQLRQIAEQQAADTRHNADLERQAQLTRDIQRSDLQDQIESVKSNVLITDREKLQIITALQAQQKKLNDADIQELESIKAQVKSLSDQLQLEAKIAELKHSNAQIDNQMTPAQQSSFAYQFSKTFAEQAGQWKGWAQESADTFSKAWNGATDSVSGGLTHLFEYGAQRGQWFREMWNGVIGSMISGVTKLAVDWVSQHIIMGAAHMAMEQGATAATAAGASERGAIRIVETVVHNTLVALRLAAHIAGEVAATAITAAQAMLRAIYHAIAAAVAAMESEASVPYVGLILGIAAGAAMMAAAYGLMGGFEKGGYTGDGHPSQIAGLVHAGEYVVPADRTSGSMNLLRAIHSGALSDASLPRVGAGGLTPPPGRSRDQGSAGGSQTNIHNAVYFDKNKMVNTLEQSDAHEKYIVDVMGRNIHKFRS